MHGLYRAGIEHLLARMWHWGIVRKIYGGNVAQTCISTCVHSCICSNLGFEDRYDILHMRRGNTYLHLYGRHLHRRTMIRRMLWVMMGMYVPFVTASLT